MTILQEKLDILPKYQGIDVIQVKAGRGHRYKVTGYPKTLPGVTTILGVIDKPGLIPWTRNTAVNKVIDKLAFDMPREDSVDAALGHVLSRLMQVESGNAPGEDNYASYLNDLVNEAQEIASNSPDWQDYLKELAAHGRAEDTRGRDEGTATHRLIEEALTGVKVDDIGDEMRDHLAPAVDAAGEIFNGLGLRMVAAEPTIWNPDYHYAGSIDFLGESEQGDLCILDWKRAKTLYDNYSEQVSAYAAALMTLTGRRVRAFVCKLPHPDDGDHYYKEVCIPEAFKMFYAAFERYQTQSNKPSVWL